MLATALIIVGLLILVVALPPLVLELTGHIKYVPAGSSENWFKQTLTESTTKYVWLGTGILLGTMFTGVGIWYYATTRTKTTPEYSRSRPFSQGYQKLPSSEYGSIPRSPPQISRRESVEDWPPPSLSRVNTPQSEYADPSSWLKESKRSSEYADPSEWLKESKPSSEYSNIPADVIARSKRLSSSGPREYGPIPNLQGLGNVGNVGNGNYGQIPESLPKEK